ncbi:hypothetical protein [Paenibacillus hamazuiensis]|uniref:hypothetical protein n=1 Tax=Paenibacillus hamazuiensis TaxID=2936508 RepID=UPI00200C635F|nr:hypothetical protein [Paenibacillus hamazuiensis]
MMDEVVNKELRDLGTHAAGAVDLHETRNTERPVTVHPPDVPNPGPYDTRTGRYELQKNDFPIQSEE